eukprot:gb/GEZN01001251.1/.p1 GENE.gb/GEZN01001251.1/~~gb/GEZN01001251.1/.p1  ORF type:complete len:781 (-),score=112.62 gb/GEZN01001251.1/:724-3066(-)
MDYVLLDNRPSQPVSVLLNPVIAAVGAIATAFLTIGGWATARHFASKHAEGPLLSSASTDSSKWFIPKKGVKEVTLPGPPSLLQILPPDVPGPSALFLYYDGIPHDLLKGCAIEEAWLYGAKLDGHHGIATGESGDVLKGDLLVCPTSIFPEKLKVADKWKDYNPKSPDQGEAQRHTVKVVKKDGSSMEAQTYLKHKSSPPAQPKAQSAAASQTTQPLTAAEMLAQSAISMHDLSKNDWQILRQAIGKETEVVMIGEATHGTEEFYRIRADITKHLIKHEGFNVVALEGDWPSVYRLNRYASLGAGCRDERAETAFGDFKRFPEWMWKNKATLDFVKWLREHNTGLATEDRVGIYGLDLYSMFESADIVIKYLEQVDPIGADRAREQYGSLSTFRREPSEYGIAVLNGRFPSAEKKVLQVLKDLLENGPEYLRGEGGYIDGDELFYTENNALLVKDAEEYYRNAFAGGAVTWNLRDQHMMRTLLNLMEHYRWKKKPSPEITTEERVKAEFEALEKAESLNGTAEVKQWLKARGLGISSHPDLFERKRDLIQQVADTLLQDWEAKRRPLPVRVVIWAHNSHLGDATATAMGTERNELSLGQLVREHFGLARSFNVGLTCYAGSVRAAKQWGGEGKEMTVNPGMQDSYEALFHKVSSSIGREEMKHFKPLIINQNIRRLAPDDPTQPNFALLIRSNDPNVDVTVDARGMQLLSQPRIERFIGVLYVKHQEYWSHYSEACLPRQFDCVIHLEAPRAIDTMEIKKAEGIEEIAKEDVTIRTFKA